VSTHRLSLSVWLILTIIVSFIRVTGPSFRFNGYFVLNFRNIGTKYFGGHSDLLAGILVVKTLESWNQVSTWSFSANA
jgi:hypothetical protein